MTQEKRSSPKRRAVRLSPDDRRAQLRTVTLELLAEHGLGHTNHSMVAKRAGVSLPTIMHYYTDHGDLVDDVLADVADFLLNDIASRAATQEPDPIMAIEEMLVSMDVMGRNSTLRMTGDAPYVTDEGNHILDLHLGRIGDPRQLSLVLNQIPGVVENGLFVDICDTVIVGFGDGRIELRDINTGETENERLDFVENENMFADLGDWKRD